MENKTIKIFNNNKIVIDHLKGSMSNGRAIVIDESGAIISDIVYENDLANGPGFQYEVVGKKKYEGFWENGKWLRSATTNYPSFISSYKFGGIKTDKQIILYSNLVNGSPRDTCFAYDIPSGYRYFGYFENGNLTRGIRIIGKSEYSIGEFDAGGRKQGFFADFKKGHYLCLGNYKDNELNGEAMYISFSPGDTTMYDGEFKKGMFTGNGSKLDSKNIIYKGAFQNGALAEGQKIIRKVDALEKNQPLLPINQNINHHPKTICAALNFLLKEFDNNFKNITDNKEFNSDNKSENPFFDEYKALQTPYRFPGALVNKIVKAYKQNNFYFGLAISDNYSVIKSKYNSLCAQLKACNIITMQKNKIMKLSGKAKILKTGEEAITTFYIPAYGGKTTTPKIVVSLEKFKKYQLTVSITSYQEIE